ncbi:hypothetical protein ACSLPG_30280, partial [Escherichia coli]
MIQLVIVNVINGNGAFGPVHALKSVNLTVYPGEIHALIGENG